MTLRSISATLLVLSLPLLFAVPAQAAGKNYQVSVTDTGESIPYGYQFSLGNPATSADGRYTVYSSNYGVVAGDVNAFNDVYVYDRVSGKPERISFGDLGGYQPSISADGRYVAYVGTDMDSYQQSILLYDRKAQTTSRLSNGSILPTRPYISADGRFVTWHGDWSDICPNSAASDIIMHDRLKRTTVCASAAPNGDGGNNSSWNHSISADGRHVLFVSCSTNLVAESTDGYAALFLRDMKQKSTTLLQKYMGSCSGTSYGLLFAQLSADGRYATFGLNSGRIYLRDIAMGTTEEVIASGGSPGISADGNVLSYVANNNVYTYDRIAQQTRHVLGLDGSEPNDRTGGPALLAGDGRYVAFTSTADNLVPNDTNLPDGFMRDFLLQGGTKSDVSTRFLSGPTSAVLGEKLTYKIEVTASEAAANTVLQVLLPASLTPKVVTASKGECTVTNYIVCRPGKLAAGGKMTVTVKAVAKQKGKVDVVAMAGANPQDPKAGNNVARLTVRVQ